MKTHWIAAALIATGLAYAASRMAAEEAVTPRAAEGVATVGRAAPNFVLPDAEGQARALSDHRDKQLVLVVFMGTECPIGNLYLPTLNKLQEDYAEAGLQVVGVNSNPADTAEEIAAHAEEFTLGFPVLIDADGRVAETFGARRTPEVFLLDRQRVVRYRGRIDDRYGYQYKRDESRRADLRIAIDELVAGGEVSVAETDSVGCLISRRERPAAEEKITYAKQVSRIIQDKCQTCHHPGTAAPFSLLTYDDAKDWSAMIREVTLERRMPPWYADPRYGHFSNDRRLTAEELDTLVAWIDQGAPLGDAADLPPEREYADGWIIDEPDLVFELPEEVTIPADGVVPYRYFASETKFEEDVWIQAAEARPGNRAVVHHIIVFYREPNANGNGKDFDLGGNWIVGTAPGDMPLILPPGVGRRIPAGSKLIWQMHYTPTGKVEKDRSQIGLVLYKGDGPPPLEARTRGIANMRFEIPPGEANHRVESRMVIPRDVKVLSFMPHMHLRGKDFEFRATYPDGQSEVLLSVPRYDFNWQSTYRLAEPRRMPRGTRIDCTAHFDNSEGNPANPDPAKSVRWGDQTWEEMMIGYVDYIPDNEESN